MADKTKHAFDVKANPQYSKLSDTQLNKAAQFILLEAGGWDNAISVLDQSSMAFDSQIGVMAMYSIELYLKAILMFKGINITTCKKSHKIDVLFGKLSSVEQDIIRQGVKSSSITFWDFFGDYILLSNFDEILKFISLDFIHLRYKYEKFMHGEPVYILNDFILSFRDSVRKLAKSMNNNQ